MFRLPRPRLILAILSALLLGACLPPPAPPVPAPPAASVEDPAGVVYPESRRGSVVDDYHGTPIADPYRWLEDSNSPETRAWIERQNELTFSYLEEIPARDRVKERLTELWDYQRYSVPFERGGRYFYRRNDGLQDQSVLYWQPSLDAEPRLLLDPNRLSADGTVSLATVSISEDGEYLAWGTSEGGSDWREFRVREVATGRDLADHLQLIKFSGAAWTHDHAGFFYSRYPEPVGDEMLAANRNQKLYYHRIGTPQSEDVLVYERPDHPDWGFGAGVSDDGRYLVVSVSQGTDRRNRLYYLDLEEPQNPRLDGEMVRLLDDFDAGYSYIHNDGPLFYLRTDLDAPRGRVIAIDTRDPARSGWQTVIPESDDVLESTSVIAGRFVAEYLHDAHSRVLTFSLSGEPMGEIELPAPGSAGGFRGDPDDTETFYAFTSFLYPSTIFRHDFQSGAATVFRAPEIDFDPSGYQTQQLFYTSADGTRVPMFVTHRRGLKLNGSNPTMLYGYGGFNISLTPSFSVSRLAWLEMGGVYAVPNLRGGGEYGEEWHQAGRLRNKQNVFDDFIAAAEYLISAGYTSPEWLAIAGGSNGGLLVGAAMTQRPALFGAALPAVGVMDMLRFHQFTIGWAWVSEYGSADDPEMFPVLYGYSPLHNLEPGVCYPPTLVTTADHDDRVVPGHSFKFAAALQAAQGCPEPALIRVETRAGHGAGKPTWMIVEEQADQLAFLLRELGSAKPRATGVTTPNRRAVP